MQLDIFDHSRDVMLRNDVLASLERRESTAARAAWHRLGAEFPGDPASAPLAKLIEALDPGDDVFTQHPALQSARTKLVEQIEPAALQMFGQRDGAAWLVPLWRNLAERAAPLAFRADHIDEHAAPLWLRAGDAAAATHAVTTIESWRRIPAPLAWMTEARHRTFGFTATWALWAELAWLAPARFDALSRRLADPIQTALRQRFDAAFEGDGDISDLAWLPAWLLTEDPSHARWLREAQTSRQLPPETALRLMLELLGLERQGRHHDLIERRKVLRDLHSSLYASYLRTR